jgi:hypothetical protein
MGAAGKGASKIGQKDTISYYTLFSMKGRQDSDAKRCEQHVG